MTSIKLKRSSTPSSAPRIEDLLLGELAVNTYDGIIYLKQQVGTTTSIISLQPLRASTIDGASIIGEIQNISALRFDTDSNFILIDLGNGAVKVSTQNLNPIDVGLVNSAFSYTNTVSNISSVYFYSNDGFIVDSVAAGVSRVRLPSVTTATNLNNGQSNQIPYQSSPGTTHFIAQPITTGTFLSWNGSNFAWAPTLTVGNIGINNVLSNTVTNVSVLRFDSDSGFDVVDLGGGAAKIQLNSTFKFWNVNGTPGLIAEGLDTVNFVAATGTNIAAVTSGTDKSIIFSINSATTSTLGAVKIGSGIDISNDGTISVNLTTGPQGPSGPQGQSGTSGDNVLVWTTSGNYRTLTGYREESGIQPIRTAEFSNNLLRLTLATFSPALTATPIPGSSLNWDVAATGFSVSVDNPSDFTSSWISSVLSITGTAGTVGTLTNFTAGSATPVPAGGVDWTQSFSNGFIRPTSTTITGGSAAAQVRFNYNNGAGEQSYTSALATFSVSWATPSMSLSLSSLSGATFLGTYTSVAYSISVTGIANSQYYSHSITSVGGTVTNNTGSGTFTFATAIHKNNTANARTVTNSTTFTRPSAVTGSAYTATIINTTANPSASFSYPSFWIFTSSTGVLPTRADIVNNFGFENTVNQLADQTKTFAAFVNNTGGVPRAFWFAIRASASQPTTFKTGASASLLSDVGVTNGGNVALEPDSPGAGYIAENYTFYGITLQAGQTYVSIG